MNFALLLSSLPRVDEARDHYDRMLAPYERTPGRAAQRIVQLWQRFTRSLS